MRQLFWWESPRSAKQYDVLIQAIRKTITTNSTWRSGLACDRFTMAFAYDRDRLFTRFQSQTNESPGGKSARRSFGWLDGQTNVPSPNIVRSTVDTVLAWTVAEQPPITVSASGASFEDGYAIEEFETALDSIFNTPLNEETMRLVGRDGILSGYAYAMPVFQGGEIKIRKLFPWQVYIDPFDARDGNPRSVHVMDYMDRADVLHIIDTWNGLKQKTQNRKRINDMDPSTPSINRGGQTSDEWSPYDIEMASTGTFEDADRLQVVYSWRVASAPGRSDGRFTMTVCGQDSSDGNTVVLVDQKFGRTTLPVCWFNPLPPASGGIWGTGFGQLILPWQEALDRSMIKIQRCLDILGHIRIVVSKGSVAGQQKTAMSKIGVSFVEMDEALPGGVPVVYDPQVVRKEDVDHVERILQMSQSVYGINQMMARGASQLGSAASGTALQEEHYRSLDRFSDLVKNWQSFRLRLAEESLNVLDDALKIDKTFRANYEYLGRPSRQSWADLSRLKEKCGISLEVRGSAAMQRGGRTARIQEWASQGLISADIAKESLLSSPDVRAATRVALAPIRLVEWQIRKVIESEDWFDAKPDRDTPIEIAITRATASIQRAHVEGAKPETIERLREYKATAEALLPPPPPPAPPPGPPAMGPVDPMAGGLI